MERIYFVEMLANVRVKLEAPAGPSSDGTKLLVSDNNIILPLALQFPTRIPNVAAGGTEDTNCRATVDKILLYLTRTGINPSA